VTGSSPETRHQVNTTSDARNSKGNCRGTVELRRTSFAQKLTRKRTERLRRPENFRVASGTLYYVVVDGGEEEKERAAIDGERIRFSHKLLTSDGNKLYYLDFRNEVV